MRIGIPKEIKDHEARVGLTPTQVAQLVEEGNQVFVRAGAGSGCHFADEEYLSGGAQILTSHQEVYETSELIVKVKEPQPVEVQWLDQGQILFAYLHLAAAPELTKNLLDSGVCGIGYETVETADGQLPLLIPMSEIAGKMAVQEGAKYLESTFGGRGILLGGIPGVPPAQVTILGGGTAGMNAAKVALGMGSHVTVLEISITRIRYLVDVLPGISVLRYSPRILKDLLPMTDLLIGTVLIHGAHTPRLLTREDLKLLPKGAVVVDVSIDQGGCFETSHPTSHSDPVYTVDGIIHYCVTNMPGVVANTSTLALTLETFPFVSMIACDGLTAAIQSSPPLGKGIQTINGHLTNKSVAEALGIPFTPLATALESIG
jgi:alanine dehydrogenase